MEKALEAPPPVAHLASRGEGTERDELRAAPSAKRSTIGVCSRTSDGSSKPCCATAAATVPEWLRGAASNLCSRTHRGPCARSSAIQGALHSNARQIRMLMESRRLRRDGEGAARRGTTTRTSGENPSGPSCTASRRDAEVSVRGDQEEGRPAPASRPSESLRPRGSNAIGDSVSFQCPELEVRHHFFGRLDDRGQRCDFLGGFPTRCRQRALPRQPMHATKCRRTFNSGH